MNGIEFKNFHKQVCYLPEGSSILFLGTGPSVVYNLSSIIAYIDTFNPIIIGINGYFKGLQTIKHIGSLKSVYSRKDVDISLIPNNILEDYAKLIPDVLFTNYLLQGEKCKPDGSLRKKSERGDKYSNKMNEKLEDNLFHNNIIKMMDEIIDNNVYMCCANNYEKNIDGKRREIHYGQIDGLKYEKSKGFDLFPKEQEYLYRDIFNLPVKNLSSLFNGRETTFAPMHGGEYVLSWIHANSPSRVAICGIYDHFKQNSPDLIRNWFWCNPGRELPKNMLKTQSVIIDLYKKEYGDSFVDLNLKDVD